MVTVPFSPLSLSLEKNFLRIKLAITDLSDTM